MQCKRRRYDIASTEVGEVSGGRVTQQAFEVIHKKDSEISNAAMPGTRGDGRKDAQENITEPVSPSSPGPFAPLGDGCRAVEEKQHAGAGI